MRLGETFDLVEIVGDTVKYSSVSSGLVFGQQCAADPIDYGLELRSIHFVEFGYGHHPTPIVFYSQDLKKIGKLTITKIKQQ